MMEMYTKQYRNIPLGMTVEELAANINLRTTVNKTEYRMYNYDVGEALDEGIRDWKIPEDDLLDNHADRVSHKYYTEGGQRPNKEEIDLVDAYKE